MMPLQSSGIIVVNKPTTAVTTQPGSATASANSAAHHPQQQFYHTQQTTTKAASGGAATTDGTYFEYYGTNDVRQPQQQPHQKQQLQLQQHNVAGSSNNHTSSRSQTQLPLMRRAQQRNNSNSNLSYNKCSSSNTTTTGGVTNTKIHQINIKQQQQQQQQLLVQMNHQQQHQIIQHTTIHQQQQQQHQIHQQQSQELATQLPQQQHHQSKQQQQQHVQKQHPLSQQMHSHQQQQQQQQLQQQSQQQAQPQQQVIQVSEEFIEQATASGAANMMISTTSGEVLNPQIFKIVATDGTTGNMIIDSGSAAAVGGQSKVLLSNLTVLAKQTPNTSIAPGAGGSITAQQQHGIGVSSGSSVVGNGQQQQAQTINYMNAKNLSYLTTAAAAAPLSSPINTGGGKTQKYTVTGTYKTGVKQPQQQLTSTTYIQQPQQQTGQPSTAGSQQLYQKLSVPRQVQMLTRVQTVVQQPAPAVTSMPTNTGQQQQQTQMLVQPVVGGQKYLSSSATTKSVSVTSNTGNMLKKSNSLKISHANSKVMNNMQMQQQQGVKTTYISQQQQQQYQLHQPQYQSSGSGKIKTSKLLKQYNNVMNNNSSGVNMLQQQPLGTYTISSSGCGGHKLQQTTKVTKMAGNKYGAHQQQMQHVATLPQGTHLHHKTVAQQQQQQQFSTSNNVVTLAGSVSGGSNNNNGTLNVGNSAGSTIKFVNSTHATVIQQHQTPTLPMQQQQQQTKVTLRQQQQQIQFVDAPTTAIVKDNSGSNAIYQPQAQSSNNTGSANTQSLLNDDIMIVNGTQMTDELSARILQSMAQKSFSNQQRYQQQQQTKSLVMPPPTAQQAQQQQQIVLQQHASSTSVLLSPKEYPLYGATQLSAQQQQHQQSAQQQQLSAPTTINSQFSNTAVHHTPISATAYLPVSAAAAHASCASSGAVYAAISTSGTSIGRQTHSAPGSRTHSLERNKSYEASTTITRKTAIDYYKANNSVGGRGHHHASHASASLSATSTNIPHDMQQQQQQQQHSSAQIIHLQTLKSSLAATTAAVAAGNSSYTIATNSPAAAAAVAANNTAAAAGAGAAAAVADDEDIIGEEVRPAPVTTQDLRLRILHAVQQDHTYANAMPAHLAAAEGAKSGGANAQQMQMGKASSPMLVVGGTTQSHLQSALTGNVGGNQQWSLGGIGATVASGQLGLGSVLPTPLSSGQSTFTLHGQQIPRMQQDDDAHSAISNGSRVATGDIDPGEETETAAEAEAEDDSVTRCICDLTHDDGYMICCDKCFAWQHVDCMGIDRQNIPDEYQCEVCQPRQVDKARARALQLMKRKEQTQLLLSAQSAHATGSSGAYLSGATGGGNYQLADGQQRQLGAGTSNSFMMSTGVDGTMHGLPNNTAVNTTKKGKVLKKTVKETAGGKKSKKADKVGAGSSIGGKPPRKDSTTAKKTTKRKTKSGDGLSASASAAEKHAANLRQWIENYELAVTNHYSPELRARLHAITKQPSLLQSILNTENRALKECCNNGLENRASTVPHAGGKILISNMDIAPCCPIFELRGKYMLSPQYKTQNASLNMNSPPPNNYLAASLKAHKTPGPFIFFYQLPDAEAPMQTMNQDGSYPPLPPQPAYLKGPEICVDTRTYGNEARFVRRSCRPNAEIQHLFEKGTIHLFIVATTRIRASTEITIKHEPHDLFAIENKKATSSNCIVQPTSTACACGLLKDCLFGPPPTQQFQGAGGASKSSSRKSTLATTLNGGVQLNSSAAAMQLTMGGLPSGGNKKKGSAQNINRNRSTSSSGDSSIGGVAGGGMNSPIIALPTAPLNMNANICSNTFKSNGGLNILSAHALAATAVLPATNGNISTTSSVSSVMHDSGICTSSSSPSVSIPSPSTLHIHSPTQQQQQTQPQTVSATTTVQRSNSALFLQHSPQQQQQHQQILGALPTPLLLSPPQQLVQPQTQLQAQQQQQQQQEQEQQSQDLVGASGSNTNAPLLQEVVTADAAPAAISRLVSQSEQQPQSNLPLQQPQEQQEMHVEKPSQQQMHSELVGAAISDASLAAAAALQSLNTAVTLTTSSNATVSVNAPACNNSSNNSNFTIAVPEATTPTETFKVSAAEQQQQQLQQEQIQLYAATSMQPPPRQDVTTDDVPQASVQQQQQPHAAIAAQLPPPPQAHAAIATSPHSGSKSPQKHSTNPGVSGAAAPLTSSSTRIHKTSAKSSSSRSTSFSEDDHQQQQHNTSSGSVNDDTTVTTTSKEKPKLSREDRKMEAILRAIEKMERNQQRKSQQSKSGGTATSAAAKRRNSNSISPNTPAKRIGGELSASGSSGRVSAVAARKKKRKAHKSYSGHSAQARKRRKSRINSSNESADGGAGSNSAGLMPAGILGNAIGGTTAHSETESASLLSPAAPLATTAQNYQLHQPESSEVAVDTATPPTNEDQAAGLLLAFANPNLKMSPTPQKSPQNASPSPTTVQQQQYTAHYAIEQLKSPQHRMPTGGGNGASPPATPVSSACLLIEAAVGPLQEHMDGSSPSGEFKYPNKTKTKKVLMSNWLLNQVDADTSGSDSPPPSAPTPPPSSNVPEAAPVAVATCAAIAAPMPTANGTLGLDSLVQAATMCDYSKQKPEGGDSNYGNIDGLCTAPMPVDEPQNLSMAAQKVEEFIQQTERGSSVVYNTRAGAGVGGTARNLLHLPLQVSTCSNNSSVKKRWLRQAISEETTTDESMTPTPTATAAASLQQHVSPTTSAAVAVAHLNAVLNVPNGFTTPLKKRRLIISGNVKEEEDAGGSSAQLAIAGDFDSPEIGLVKAELSVPERDTAALMLTNAATSDADVDVMNLSGGDAAAAAAMKHEPETSDDEDGDEEEYDEEEEERDDVDVVGGVGVNELHITTATTTTNNGNTPVECMKREILTKDDQQEVAQQRLAAAVEFKTEPTLIDQDDDVDILRSPSPGHQQMLAAEDNLVKIEPEDTSGGEDVKIDVEREESLAGDKFEELVLMQVKKEEAEMTAAEQAATTTKISAAVEVKVTVEADEDYAKPVLCETAINAKDFKSYVPNEQHKKQQQPKAEIPPAVENKPIKVESKPFMDRSEPTINNIAMEPSAEEMLAVSVPAPLKLLTLDDSSTISPEEPLKKRVKLETSTTIQKDGIAVEESQQTSLLKPLSTRMLEMPKQAGSSAGANNSNNNNDIMLQIAATLPDELSKTSTASSIDNLTLATPASTPPAAMQSNCMTFLAAAAAAAIERKPPPPPPATTATATTATVNAQTTTTAQVFINTNDSATPANTPPDVTSTVVDVACGDFNVTPSPLPNNSSNGSSTSIALAPRKQNAATNNSNSNERKIPLTDDDIQACLHSFHKENILILQSRNNKKSKSNSATASAIAATSSELSKSAKLVENKSSTASSYSSHHSHHHSHVQNDVTAKSVGGGNKHCSTSKSFTNLSSSSGSSSAKKLHKKERNGKEHTSSSSSSRTSFAHSGKLSAVSNSANAKKVSSSHKKDYASGKVSGSTTPVSNSKQQQPHGSSASYNNSNSSSSAPGGGDSKEREERRERDNNSRGGGGERGFDKERHHYRHRTTSVSSSTNSVTQTGMPATSTTPTPPPPISKKRQLNFEQELTKDLPLVKAAIGNSSRHRKDSGSRDDMISSSCSSSSSNSLAARKRRESSSSSGGGSRHRNNSSSSCGATEQQMEASAHKPAVAEHNCILTGTHVVPLPSATYMREHVAIPHFNNVVVSGPPPPLIAAYFSGIGAVPGSSMDASMGTPIATYVPTPALPPSTGIALQPSHSLLKTLPMQPALSHLAAAVHAPSPLPSAGGSATALSPPSSAVVVSSVMPPAAHSPGAVSSLLACNSNASNSTVSTYNSIYGKLRDSSPVIAPPQLGAGTAALASTAATSSGISATAEQPSVSANISLSEYLDTKVKSYSTTMGAYVPQSHAYISGGSVSSASSTSNLLQSVSKASNNSTSGNSSAVPENISVATTPIELPVVSKLPTPLKLPLTRTASHDPRLNPQLNVPEPPPAPKRKLSINEYRKRMQLSSDSITPSAPEATATVSAPTTPAGSLTPNSLNNSFVQAYNSLVNASPEEMARQLSASPTTLTMNKYTLNSPERKRRHSGSDKEQRHKRHSGSYDDVTGLLNSSTGSSSCGNMSDTSMANLNNENDGKKGQFSAAPTLLEKQQEKLCERLKLFRNMNKSVTSLSSAANEFASLKKDCDLYVNRTNSISSTDNLDNCLEEISSSSSSSSSSSPASSRDASPERICVSSGSASAYKRATNTTTSTSYKWLHESETPTANAARVATPSRDEAAATRSANSESAT